MLYLDKDKYFIPTLKSQNLFEHRASGTRNLIFGMYVRVCVSLCVCVYACVYPRVCLYVLSCILPS